MTNPPRSQFKDVKSTFPTLKLAENYSSPYLFEDPRTSIQQSEIAKSSKIYRPYPRYNSDEWKRTHRGAFVPCVGPRGKKLDQSLDDSVSVYLGAPKGMLIYLFFKSIHRLICPGFPTPSFGSHEAVGIDGQLSYDRYGRYAAYGFGEDDPNQDWIRPSKVDWNTVNWGQLQQECVHANAGRFNTTAPNEGSGLAAWFQHKAKPANLLNQEIKPETRTAILIRSYTDKVYSENDKQVIRSMVQELSLQSGGEYEVFLLVHVKDDNVPIHQKEIYEKVLNDNIPQEFWNMTILWSMPMVSERYNKLDPKVMK
jgi:hypothetical protein